MRTLVLGGVRSGKSAYAELLASTAESVRYVATAATPPTGDPDWSARIAAHAARRPNNWTLIESGDVATHLRDDPSTTTLVDDLGNWVTRLLDETGSWNGANSALDTSVDELASAVASFTGDLVLVSPEVGLSLVASTPSGRRFQDALGHVNTVVAAAVDRVVLIVAGQALYPQGIEAVPPASVPPPASLAAGSIATTHTPVAEPPSLPPEDSPTLQRDPAVLDQDRTVITAHVQAPLDFPDIVAPDARSAEAARAREDALTKPKGALGRLEDLAVWAASCQGVCPPTPFADPVAVIFAGDHGVAAGGVSAYPSEVTTEMVAAIANGVAAVNVMATSAGARVQVHDISVAGDTAAHVQRYKVRAGSNDLRTTNALSLDDVRTAIAHGRAIADELIDGGTDLLIPGDLGIANTTPAAIIVGLLTNTEPVAVIGRGTGIDDTGWIAKVEAIRDGMRRGRSAIGQPAALLAAIGGADIAAMTGFIAQGALRRTPIILDGVVVTAAAMLAEQLAPGASAWCLAGHCSAEPAHAIALTRLDKKPLLEFGMRLGEGTGALTALPVVQSAVATLAYMATFDDAGVSTPAQ